MRKQIPLVHSSDVYMECHSKSSDKPLIKMKFNRNSFGLPGDSFWSELSVELLFVWRSDPRDKKILIRMKYSIILRLTRERKPSSAAYGFVIRKLTFILPIYVFCNKINQSIHVKMKKKKHRNFLRKEDVTCCDTRAIHRQLNMEECSPFISSCRRYENERHW